MEKGKGNWMHRQKDVLLHLHVNECTIIEYSCVACWSAAKSAAFEREIEKGWLKLIQLLFRIDETDTFGLQRTAVLINFASLNNLWTQLESQISMAVTLFSSLLQ